MAPKNSKRCCERFRNGLCTDVNCKFPHVVEASKTKREPKWKEAVVDIHPVHKHGNHIGKTGYQAPPPIPKLLTAKRRVGPYQFIGHDEEGNLQQHCKECGQEFTLPPAELDWFKSMEFSFPKTCKECRDLRKPVVVKTTPYKNPNRVIAFGEAEEDQQYDV